ncbi:hypothetical protein [Rhodoferax sp.]|nr:hypothetical protein [Rhodoferax sp.]MDD3936136.1 hypothetical protein [Rhodoferax sp.]
MNRAAKAVGNQEFAGIVVLALHRAMIPWQPGRIRVLPEFK